MKKTLIGFGCGAAVVVLVALWQGWFGGHDGATGLLPTSLTKTAVNETATLSVLHSEAMAFLVTRRTTTQVVVEHGESNFFGDWQGVLWATVTWQWGVDLKKVGQKDLRREGNVVICRLPEPEMLNFAVEPGSIGFMSRSTAIPKAMTVFGSMDQRRLMEGRLRAHAMKFAEQNKLMPTRQEMVAQVNGAVAIFNQGGGVELRFE